jgi:hypothetical protein
MAGELIQRANFTTFISGKEMLDDTETGKLYSLIVTNYDMTQFCRSATDYGLRLYYESTNRRPEFNININNEREPRVALRDMQICWLALLQKARSED